MSRLRRFDPDELGNAGRDDRDDALAAGHWLDEAANLPPIAPSAGFGDRVMAALAAEPTPAPAGFLAPLRRRGFIRGFGASVRQAWSSVGAGRPLLVRAPALAYVLAVAIAGTSLAGVATVGVAGALGVFQPRPSQSAPPETPGPTLPPQPTTGPPPSDGPSGESEPPQVGESDDPAGSTEPSDDHGGDAGPGSSGSGSDDNSGPGSSGSGSGSDDSSGPSSTSGSGSDDGGSSSGSGSTPRPTDTPRPTGTPKPTETPH